MKGVKQRPWSFLVPAVIQGAMWTLLAASGLFFQADAYFSDLLYQRESATYAIEAQQTEAHESPRNGMTMPAPATEGEIVILGIDAASLEALGSYPWSRQIWADVIHRLNHDPQNRPAVIGLDLVFAGETDEAADLALVEAAGAYDNVVIAAFAEYSARHFNAVDEVWESDTVTSYIEPFSALKQVAQVGHINAMYDTDGVLRHSLLFLQLPEKRVESFAWVIYQKYCAYHKLLPNPAPPTDGQGRWYLPFKGKSGFFSESLSVSDLLSGQLEPRLFSGKMVLIGPWDAGLQDAYITGIERSKHMYGVEIQANTIQAFLEGRYKQAVSFKIQWLLLFGITCIGSIVFERRRPLQSAGLWLLGCGLWLLICLLCYEKGLILPVLWVPAALTFAYGRSGVLAYLRARREKHAIADTFSRYVDPSIVAALIQEDSESLGLGGRLCNIAVLFVDIRGFTALSEALPAPAVVEILNKCLTLTTACVLKNGGTLDKFVGDCTMAFWNAPLAQADYHRQACQAALDMMAGAQALSEEIMAAYGKAIAFGIGIHAGPAVVGNIGTHMRMDFTAIGDTVNVAARLESIAPPGCIYISRAVADQVSSPMRVRTLGTDIPLKGKGMGFEVLVLENACEAWDEEE